MKRKIHHLILFIFNVVFLTSCSNEQNLNIDYSFETAINTEYGTNDFQEINFKSSKNLDLGFHKGNIWVKLSITNGLNYDSYVVMMGDLINRNYRFFKLDTANKRLNAVTLVDDLSRYDHRTFNNPKPNFKINLNPNEIATFYITTESDGRILQATPKLLQIEVYRSLISRKIIFNIIFYAAIGLLLLINIFYWSVLKNRIYYFYGFYILTSCLFYLNVEGYLYGLGLTHESIDHFMFVSIRVWIFSSVLFTANFLELSKTYPKFYRFIIGLLILVLVGTTVFQFVFFDTSISYLHLIENLFGFMWVLVSISIISLSIKKRKTQAKYYLIAFSFLLFFIILGLIDSHTALLPGDPFSYFKIGTIIEFIGFTYFIAYLIKNKLRAATVIEQQLLLNQQELSAISEKLQKSIESSPANITFKKTDLLSIFKLLESSLSKEIDWPDFKLKFEELSPYFLTNLSQKHPDLSKSEIRLLILVRIGFTQKEIANILNIAPDSAKKAKQRVRKKLGINSSIILSDYLAGLGNENSE